MKISNQILQGNNAELLVAYLLSEYCLVRTVASGTDIGIDLYCELLRENRPFLHFWVQVKSSKSDTIRELKGGGVSYSFKSSHLAYWKFQPVPVFVFLLSNTGKTSPEDFNIHILDVTEYLLSNEIKNSKTQTLRTKFVIRSKKELRGFLFNKLEVTTARQKLNLGIIYPTLSSQDEYVKHVFPDGSGRFAKNILHTIRTSSSFIIQELIDYENSNPTDDNAKDRRKRFARILQAFEPSINWEVPYHLGLSYYQDKDYNNAKTMFERALKIIKIDRNIDQNKWEPTKTKISNWINTVDTNINGT